MIINEERRVLQESARLLARERFGLLAADLPETPGEFCFGEEAPAWSNHIVSEHIGGEAGQYL